MTEKGEVVRRLTQTHAWAQKRAMRTSEEPSRFLDHYDREMKEARTTACGPDTPTDYSDPIKLAAEIEARAAWRRVENWYTGKGMLKSRWYQEMPH